MNNRNLLFILVFMIFIMSLSAQSYPLPDEDSETGFPDTYFVEITTLPKKSALTNGKAYISAYMTKDNHKYYMVLKNFDTDQRITIQFQGDGNIELVEVPPGNYGFLYLYGVLNAIKVVHYIYFTTEPEWMKCYTVGENQILYFGDWSGDLVERGDEEYWYYRYDIERTRVDINTKYDLPPGFDIVPIW